MRDFDYNDGRLVTVNSAGKTTLDTDKRMLLIPDTIFSGSIVIPQRTVSGSSGTGVRWQRFPVADVGPYASLAQGMIRVTGNGNYYSSDRWMVLGGGALIQANWQRAISLRFWQTLGAGIMNEKLYLIATSYSAWTSASLPVVFPALTVEYRMVAGTFN
ncbi:hypothetical protein H2509_20600 [Stappia sp. F7233]|uniref:Uncharacterized protein n=1 Tax=Stappia albiluteola TaxID=2758565 RepID=A0A839AK36_9HYPH|nr:hypothetical protein [Stappia albiluteola]MBA5777432.1 hypothetical protein [Stappia albiluteola]MBA5779505.1 hypothetical protein [Stappia albiluteola]MBA5779538.1 hypothetical protein [Stappia albiluteola]